MAIDREPVDLKGDPNEDAQQKTPQQIASYWLENIETAEKKRKPFIVRGRQIVKRYKNKRTLTTLGVPIANRRMNVLWSNVQTQKPVLFAQTPKANVSRRNKTKDPVGRVASIVLQNCLQNSIGMEDFDFIMSQVVDDRLLPGAGIAMVEYVPKVEGNQVGWQAAETRYIHWEDWLTNPARVWQENWFFAYRVWLTRKECYDVALASSQDEKFAEDVWREITLDHKPVRGDDGGKKPDETGPAKAQVWVVWDMLEKRVVQVSPGYPKAPLAVLPPPVDFDNFWPCPRPLQSTTTNDSTIPVPDFEQYVDQADEIDLLTQRIGTLSKALRLRGLYPADMDSLKALVEGGDADMIPYDNWALIAERGGAESLVLWFPIEAIAKTLMECIQVRDQAIQIMYQVTGISDIIRGATEASETATAQQLKAQFGGIRIRESQKEVQRFIRDLLRLKAEIICEHFSLDVIKAMSGVQILSEMEKVMVKRAAQMWQQFGQAQQQYPQMAQQAQQQGMMPPPAPQPPAVPQPSDEMMEALEEPSWEQVMGILKNEKLRGFVVDVETDSTIEPDQQAQQAAAEQFVMAVAQFMTAALPIMQAEPDAADFLGEMLSWATRQWKGADTIEGAVDEFVDKMKKKAEARENAPPQPTPEQMQAQADVHVAQVGAQVAQQKGQVEIQKAAISQQTAQQKAQIDMQQAALAQQTAQIGAQAEQTKAQIDLAGTLLEHQATTKEKAMDAALAEQQHKQAMKEAKAKPKGNNDA